MIKKIFYTVTFNRPIAEDEYLGFGGYYARMKDGRNIYFDFEFLSTAFNFEDAELMIDRTILRVENSVPDKDINKDADKIEPEQISSINKIDLFVEEKTDLAIIETSEITFEMEDGRIIVLPLDISVFSIIG